MKRKIASLVSRLCGDESGAVIVLVAIAIVALIGLGALALDIGNIAWARARLQATTDLAAISGAAQLSCTACSSSTVTSAATSYSAASMEKNVQFGLAVTMASGYPKLACLTSIGSYVAATQQCTGAGTCTAAGASKSGGCNAIEVQQQTTVPFSLGKIFGLGSVTLTATSWAAKGGALPPMDIMIVLDNTGSMNSTPNVAGETVCGGLSNPSRLDCALAGIQVLLSELWPTQDEVGLMVFPPVLTTSANNDANCGTASISPQQYSTYPSTSTYQIVGPSNSYKSSNTSSLANAGTAGNPGQSSLVNATCQPGLSVTDPVTNVTSTCTACSGVKAVGGPGTYLAGAITAAQSSLARNNPPASDSGIQNVIIVLSDGGAGNAASLWQAGVSVATATNGTTLTFASGTVPGDVIVGSAVNYECTVQGSGGCTSHIPAGTTVVSVDSTASIVTLSNKVTGTVPVNTQINFGGINQCHEAIAAAQAAASAGTWVYSIAYGSYLQLSPNSNSCSDTETPAISSCTTMQDIANSPGSASGTYFQDNSRFFSDPMGLTSPNGPCVSLANPNATTIVSIFENLGFQFSSLIPIGTQ